MTIVDNSATISMEAFIDISLKNSIQFQNSSYFMMVGDTLFEDYNIIRDRYYSQIMQYTTLATLSDAEYLKYKYRPKAMSAVLYGTIDYWYILLLINKMSSIIQFKKKKVRVLTSDGIRFIKKILQKEEENISDNKLNINRQITNA